MQHRRKQGRCKANKASSPGPACPSKKNVSVLKKKRERKSAFKAAVVPGAGDMGGSPTNNLKEALF